MTRLRFVILALLLVGAACSSDDGDTAGDGALELTIGDAWYRSARADLAAGYVELTNDGDAAVTLRSASTAAAGTTELHETTMNDDGTMAMAEVPEGFTIEPGETLVLEPGGKHLMFLDYDGADAEAIDVDLVFDAGSLTIDFAFDAEASAGAGEMDHGEMEMGDDSMGDGEMEMDDDSMDDDSMDDGDEERDTESQN